MIVDRRLQIWGFSKIKNLPAAYLAGKQVCSQAGLQS